MRETSLEPELESLKGRVREDEQADRGDGGVARGSRNTKNVLEAKLSKAKTPSSVFMEIITHAEARFSC